MIVAGVSHMKWKRFLLYDVAGAVIWGTGHSVLGYALGRSYERWERYATPAGLEDHWKQGAESWEDFGAFMEWAGKVKVAVLHGSPVIHSLW